MKLFEIRSRAQGILRRIDWDILFDGLQDLPQLSNKKSSQMEWLESLGDWLEKDSVIAVIYSNEEKAETVEKNSSYRGGDEKDEDEEEVDEQKTITPHSEGTDNKDNKDNSNIDQKILSAIDIGQDRDISNDPTHGIEILGSLAIKSTNQFDIDVVTSCVTGLFRVLSDVFKSEEKIGIPFSFTFKPYEGDRNGKREKDKKQQQGEQITNCPKFGLQLQQLSQRLIVCPIPFARCIMISISIIVMFKIDAIEYLRSTVYLDSPSFNILLVPSIVAVIFPRNSVSTVGTSPGIPKLRIIPIIIVSG